MTSSIPYTKQIHDRRDLERLCEVSKSIYTYTVPRLYQAVTIRVGEAGKPVCSLEAVMRSLNTAPHPRMTFYVHFVREGTSKAMLRGGPRSVGLRKQDRFYT